MANVLKKLRESLDEEQQEKLFAFLESVMDLDSEPDEEDEEDGEEQEEVRKPRRSQLRTSRVDEDDEESEDDDDENNEDEEEEEEEETPRRRNTRSNKREGKTMKSDKSEKKSSGKKSASKKSEKPAAKKSAVKATAGKSDKIVFETVEDFADLKQSQLKELASEIGLNVKKVKGDLAKTFAQIQALSAKKEVSVFEKMAKKHEVAIKQPRGRTTEQKKSRVAIVQLLNEGVSPFKA